MSNLTTVALGRWIPCLLLVLGMLMIVPEAEAQRRRGSTSRGESSRAERSKKAKKPQQANRSKQKARSQQRTRNTGSARSRTSPRSGGSKATPRRSESRTRSTQRARTQKSTPRTQRKQQPRSKQRARQSQSTKDRKAKSRDRSVKTDRSRERTRQSRTTPKARSERGTPKTRSGRQGDRVERGRNGNGRGTTRGESQTRTRRGGNNDGGISGGRATRKNSRTKAQSPRGKQRGQTRGGTVQRGKGKASPPKRQRGERTKSRQGDRTRTEGQRGNRTRTEGRRDTRVKTRKDVRKRRKVRYTERNRWKRRYERDRRYHRRHYKRRYHRKKRYRPFILRPFIHVDIRWPWVHRHHHGWRPKYIYKQVIYVDAGWGHSGHRQSQIDVRTHYYHELRSATDNKADIDIYIEKLELYENGRYIGEITHVPERIGRIRATVYRNGEVQFDRNVFVVGNTYTGFEMISTRYYDGYLLDSYRRGHGMRVAVLDLNRRRAVPASHSYLFDPHNFDGHVPVSLLPENTGWLLDYGNASFSANYYDHDPYYYGGYKEYGNEYNDPYYGDDYYEEDYYQDDAGRPYYSVRSTVAEGNFDIAAQAKTYNQNYKTSFGAQVKVKRETEFVRVK